MLADAGATCTEATGTIATLIVAVAVLLSLVAVIVAEPWVTPATCPVLLTVATLGLLLAHVTGRRSAWCQPRPWVSPRGRAADRRTCWVTRERPVGTPPARPAR